MGTEINCDPVTELSTEFKSIFSSGYVVELDRDVLRVIRIGAQPLQEAASRKKCKLQLRRCTIILSKKKIFMCPTKTKTKNST